MSRFTGENGRLKGCVYSQPAPSAAIALLQVSLLVACRVVCRHSVVLARRDRGFTTHIMTIQSNMYDVMSRFEGLFKPRNVGMVVSTWVRACDVEKAKE